MEKLVIEGGYKLEGEVSISGSKNAVLPVLAATLLAKGEFRIGNVPRLKDVETMMELLKLLGCEVEWIDTRMLRVDTSRAENYVAPYDVVKKMRASVLVMGSLVGRLRRAVVSYPGGCAIGVRPIDMHLEGLKKMGCDVELKGGYVDVNAQKIRGAKISFKTKTVGGTENLMMASVCAPGETILENAAREPEVVDLARMLKKMGAKIEGEGTDVIRIEGVSELHPCDYEVIPDRIEAGTYLVACGITGGEVIIKGCIPEHLRSVIEKLREAGMEIVEKDGELLSRMRRKRPIACSVSTMPYPHFPTDMQAQFMAFMCVANGISRITENIFENRMLHVAELKRMGADIELSGRTAVVRGVKSLSGAKVMASDLRASASLVLAGLRCEGVTEVLRIYHLDRGYERIEEKLKKLGAKIERVEDEDMGA
ncbi:MAG: UDP-N-acetylglucosamine 1-carboxyvinyltransferase [Desulfobacterota bacterium]|nr:UDP-N-acetylglucosamine 1-carboxyvinyltransferase [Thermodesulfobacteriota bacterium]MDW8001674.1 UDP-N-acetylglucosamine 1-carboxyvinyltransferase [Deltaproteobacteria bacterium]